MGFCKAGFSAVSGRLSYRFNGSPILCTPITEERRPGFRMFSDGNLQSRPLIQQLFLVLDPTEEIEVIFFLSHDAVNMRPSRARCNEPILAQVGRPLLYGVNGLYDIHRDILVFWEGANWRWVDSRLQDAVYDPEADQIEIATARKAPAGRGLIRGTAARLRVELSSRPWTVQVLMRYYRDHLGYSYHLPWQHRPNLNPITGWCSWQAYGRDVDAENLRKAAAFLQQNLAPYGLEYVQVDDGFQSEPFPPSADGDLGDAWLTPNARFPRGHADIQGTIVAAGLKAGIWTSAAVTNKEYAGRDGNCLCGPDGSPMEEDWIHYVPSCSQEFLRGQLVPLYEELCRKGYRYFKTDTLRHLIYEGLMTAAAAGLLTSDDAEVRFRRYITSIREGIGPDAFLLTCWGVLSQAVGVCDACRIAGDANTTWGSFRMQIYETARWFHTQRILFQVDPDHICARSYPAWARSLLSLVSLSGGLFMLSDPVDSYDPQRLEMIRRTIPAQPVMTAETGPLPLDKPAFVYAPGARRTGDDLTLNEALRVSAASMDELSGHGFGTLWSVHYRAGGRQWCVAGRFALVPLEESELPLGTLGLDPQKRYHAFDFWNQRYLGSVHGVLGCPALPLGDCQIIGLAPQCDRPAYIADDRHISMGLHFLTSEGWDGGSLRMGVRGVAGKEFSCWIVIPDGFEPEEPRGTGVEPQWADAKPSAVRRLRIRFRAEEGSVSIRFTGPG